jgi:FeS assembly SUF system protein
MNDNIADNRLPKEDSDLLAIQIVKAIKTVQDPEIPVDIFELGLIYDMYINAEKNVFIKMTLTAPGCPVAGEMVGWVEKAVREIPDVGKVDVELVFDPPWDMSRMSDEARVQLNLI